MSQPQPVSWLFAAAAAMATLTAFAQVVPPPSTPVSAPKTPAPAAATSGQYRSAFEGYQPFAEEKVLPWKDTNSTVEKIGGWRTYAKEAREPDPKASQPSAAKAAPADPHAGHGKH